MTKLDEMVRIIISDIPHLTMGKKYLIAEELRKLAAKIAMEIIPARSASNVWSACRHDIIQSAREFGIDLESKGVDVSRFGKGAE